MATSGSGKHVVIGGLGNLGRHVQRTLLQHGRSVTVVDRPAQTRTPSALVHKSVEFVPYSLGWDDPSQLTTVLKGAETVYSVVTPDVQHGTVRDFEQTNHIGIQHLIQSCQEAGVAKLVYASSLAVTNHFVTSRNQTEETPLPAMDSYITSYDRTKRLGEDLVLAANHNNLKTCALRLGAILASPMDYMMRRSFETGEASGKVYTANTQPIDTIAAHDVARAMLQADSKLSSSTHKDALAGRALFVTKCRKSVADQQTPGSHEVALYLGDLFGWQVQILPPALMKVMRTGLFWQYKLMKVPFTDPQDLPGFPPHLFMDIPDYEKTFDNALAHQVLDFEPELSWEDAVEAIADEYRSSPTRN